MKRLWMSFGGLLGRFVGHMWLGVFLLWGLIKAFWSVFHRVILIFLLVSMVLFTLYLTWKHGFNCDGLLGGRE